MEPQNARAAHRLARMLIEIAVAEVESLDVSRKAKAVSGLADCQNSQLTGKDNKASRVQKLEASFSGEESNDEDEKVDKIGSDKPASDNVPECSPKCNPRTPDEEPPNLCI